MRLKTFEGNSYKEAKEKVREALGEDAIISAMREVGGLHQIVCVVDPDAAELQMGKGRVVPSWQIETIHHALKWHQLPIDVSDRLIDEVLARRGKNEVQETLAMGLRKIFKFESLDKFIAQGRPILVFGPPGMGKTVTAAKLALAGKMMDKLPVFIAADMLRTGGIEQLEIYGKRLDVPIRLCQRADKLVRILDTVADNEFAIIDTPGINPFRNDDVEILKMLCEHKEIVPILIYSTLIDTQAGIDIAEALSKRVPMQHLIVTGEDIDRRLGRILSIAETLDLRLSYYSPRAEIVNGLADFSAPKLSELLLLDIPGMPEQKSTSCEADRNIQTSKIKRDQVEISQNQDETETDNVCQNLVVIASGKGGVGKTFTAVSLAGSLGEKGHKTLLFDGDLGLANVDIQLGLMPKCDLGSVLKGQASLQEAITVCEYFDVIAGKSGAASLTHLPFNKIKKLYEELETKICPHYDIVIADMGAGIEPPIRHIAARAKMTIIIANDEPTALTDAYAFIKVMTRQKPNINVKVIINSAENDRQGERTYKTLSQTCRNFLQITPELLGIVKRDKKVHDAIRAQKLIIDHAPASKICRDFQRIATQLWDRM